MTRPPFGFGPGDRPDEPRRAGDDPFGLSAMFGGAGGPSAATCVFASCSACMSWTGGPVNWDLATAGRDRPRPAPTTGR